ncbi:DUF2797 domain-containing protein [Pyrolobus fumarii]|nr:DUF2797 domain-containing protein [Pyrolobus fumarii]
MTSRVVIRALYPKLEEVDTFELEYRPYTLFATRDTVHIKLHVYHVDASLVVEDNDSLVEVGRGWRLHARSLGPRLCRYHEGPRGEPLKQRWCHAIAVKGGWCARHLSSPLALYERCTASNDFDACRAIDALWPDEEYIVYLVYHGAGFKIGVTRAWRFYTRLLEQPHLAAAVIARLRSALEARKLEKKLASTRGFSEGIGVSRSVRMRASLLSKRGYDVVARSLAEGIARLGLSGYFEAYSLTPLDCPVQPLLSPLRELPRGHLEYLCTWGGILVFRMSSGLVGVTRDAVIHRVINAQQ